MSSLYLSAIADRRQLAFDYGGYPRIVEPHIYGVDQDGRRALSAYQVGGGSRSGEPAGWRIFHEKKIRNPRLLDQSFAGPREGFNPSDPAFRLVAGRLE
jgi:hypothetical protein